VARMHSASFERFAGVCAILTAFASFLYAVAFVILQNVVLSALFLTAVGLLSSAVLVAIYYRLRQTNVAFALWVLVLGIAGQQCTVVTTWPTRYTRRAPLLPSCQGPSIRGGCSSSGFRVSHYS
jgi:hypothetical protein